MNSTKVNFLASSDEVMSFNKPTATPSLSVPPSTLPTASLGPTHVSQPVTLLINFDTYSSVSLSWKITTIDGELVKSSSMGTYTPFDGDEVTETFDLALGGEYIFAVYDSVGDGICCDKGQGFVAIYFGTEIVRDKVLLWQPGDFGTGNSQPFTVSLKSTFVISPSPTATPTLSPAPTITVAPTISSVDVIVLIQFDRYVPRLYLNVLLAASNDSQFSNIRYPQDIGFKIVSTGGTVFVEEQTGSFYSYPEKSLFNRTYSLPMAQDYSLTISDSKGDGRKFFNDIIRQSPHFLTFVLFFKFAVPTAMDTWSFISRKFQKTEFSSCWTVIFITSDKGTFFRQ